MKIIVLLLLVVGFLTDNSVADITDNEISQKNTRPVRGSKFNFLVDAFLIAVREGIIAAGKDEIILPDIREPLDENAWPYIHFGEVNCTNGRLRSLSSLKRTGDSFGTIKGRKLVVSTQLGLSYINITYNYQSNILGVTPHGDAQANVSSNSVKLVLSFEYSFTKCVAAVESLKVTSLGEISIAITGLYPLDTFTGQIVSKIANNLRPQIESAIETELKKDISEVIEKLPCHPAALARRKYN